MVLVDSKVGSPLNKGPFWSESLRCFALHYGDFSYRQIFKMVLKVL